MAANPQQLVKPITAGKVKMTKWRAKAGQPALENPTSMLEFQCERTNIIHI